MVIQVGLGNKENESATILDDSFLPAYNDFIQRFNPRLKEYLGKYGKSEMQLTGSSPLMQVCLLNSGLLPEDTRLARRSELETATSKADSFLRGNYTDFGLALFTEGDSYTPNDLLAKALAKDLKKRRIKIGEGRLIPFEALGLEEAQDSAYGAVFRLNDMANKNNILNLADLKWDASRKEGLACANFNRNRYWKSYNVHLGNFFGNGRVVVVSGKATAKKILSRYSENFQAERDKKFAEAEKEYQERVASLRAN